jgi:hypothetical protein
MKKRFSLFDNFVWYGMYVLIGLAIVDFVIIFPYGLDNNILTLTLIAFMGTMLHFLRRFNNKQQWTIFDLFKR